MKRIIIFTILCFFAFSLIANDTLVIYNQNQALFRTAVELDLQRGVQFYAIDDIPSTIIPESVIFIPRGKNIRLFSQSYEFDLANTNRVIV